MDSYVDRMQPEQRKIYIRRTARLLEWVYLQLERPVPVDLHCGEQMLELWSGAVVPHLATLLEEVGPKTRQTLMHESNGPTGIELLSWWTFRRGEVYWDQRRAADQQRRPLVAQRALAKLNDDELQALGLTAELEARRSTYLL